MPIDELAADIQRVAELEGQFVLRSGVTSNRYFDKYQFESRPQLLLQVAIAMAKRVPADTQVLAGLELGGIALAVVMGQLLNLETAFVRKQAKPYGTQRLAEGAVLAGRRVLLVEDIVTSGGALCEAINALRSEGVELSQALCVIDREQNGRANLAALGVELISLYRARDLR